jgi:cytochrome c oxidase assembly protein subunit 15
MDGALVPDGLGAMSPWWRNIFENAMTVQFIHRSVAYVVALYVWLLAYQQWRRGGFAGTNGWLALLALLVLLQICLGIATLLLVVPLPLALAHQVMAFLLAACAMAWLADVWPRRQTI